MEQLKKLKRQYLIKEYFPQKKYYKLYQSPYGSVLVEQSEFRFSRLQCNNGTT